jgi:peptidoglycan/LPS O-acetylase OafA/YrhL
MRSQYFEAVEGLRGVAALCVLGGHVLSITSLAGGAPSRIGPSVAALGVCIFFTLSGFLLYRPFLVARKANRSAVSMTPSYLWRRAVRIFPAYWVALTVLALWPGIDGVFTDEWWAPYSLLHVYVPGTRSLAVAWTLSVELSFYLALPVIAWLLHARGVGSARTAAWRWELMTIGGLAVLSLILRAFSLGVSEPGILGNTLLGTFSWFALGMFFAALHTAPALDFRRMRRVLESPPMLWFVASLLLLAVMVWRPQDPALRTPLSTLLITLALGLCAACVVAPAVFAEGRRSVRALLANRQIVFVGLVSYGIYLWHAPIGLWLVRSGGVLDSPQPAVVLLALLVPMSILLGAASWYCVERPLMRRAGSVKALARTPGPPVGAAPERALQRVTPMPAEDGRT